MKYVLFLGAGASTPFDFKLASEVAVDFLVMQTPRTRESNILNQLRDTVSQNGFVFDSEAVMECLQGGAYPYAAIKSAGPFLASVARTQPITRLRHRTAYMRLKEKLRDRFEEYLIAQYYKEDAILERRVELVYNRLLSKVSRIKDWKRRQPNFHDSVFDIFTTNYDNSLDVYGERTGQMCARGIRVSPERTVSFVPDEFDLPFCRLRIIKLHGSVELSRLSDGTITYDLPPSYPGQRLDGHRVMAKVMVYGLSKNLYSEPYLDLLQRLAKSLGEVSECTVVGYSFRDPWIRQVFEDIASKKGPRQFRIRLVSRSAKRIARSLSRLRPYVQPIRKTIQEFLELPG